MLARRRRRHGAVAVGAVALVTAGLASAFVGRRWRSTGPGPGTTAQAQLTPLQAEITQLQSKVSIRAEVHTYQAQVKSLLADDVDWDRLLGQIAAEMPSDVALSSFSGSTDQPGTAPATDVGTVNFNATANKGKLSIAAWLVGLRHIPALSGTWVSNLASGGDDPAKAGQIPVQRIDHDAALSARHDKAEETP